MSADRRSVHPGTIVYAMVLAATAVGLILVAVGGWRAGVGLCGCAFVLGGLVRAFLDDDAAGLLRVRRRAFDVVWMIVLGVSLAVLSVVVPRGFA